ncbi:MAG: hypothetical protein ACI8TQ_001534 [Planctomycetota bacterium]|jgi:hypothetical protein
MRISARYKKPSRRGNLGISTLELIIAMALFSVVAVKAILVLNSANETHGLQSATMSLEDQARRTLDQIAYAIMGCDRSTLFPDPTSPIFSPFLEYSLNLGVNEDGEIILDDPEKIGLSEDESQVLWMKNPDTPEETRVAWCNVVRPFMEGELMNGDDDNGNGVVDEKGLSFVVRDSAVTIRLSLERPISGGETVTQTVETIVTIRN